MENIYNEESNENFKTTVTIPKNIKLNSQKIAKKKGINTLTTLINILLVEYIEKNKELLEKR